MVAQSILWYPLLMEIRVKDIHEGRHKTSRISSKNQVTIPVAALAQAHLGPGAIVTVEAEAPGRIVLRSVEDDLDQYAGSLPNIWPPNALNDLRDEWR